MSENPAQHWADAIAQEVLQGQTQHLISTGITPSGDYHVGHLREVMTAEGVYRALVDQGAEIRFNYIADTMDPLRRVYDFLDPEVYTGEVGKPLCDIPCPCGDHASYAEHFLEPFLESMQKLGVELDVVYAHDLYRQGHLDTQIIMALEQTETIVRIEREESRKEVAADWSPFNPLCAVCGRLSGTRVTGFDAAAKTVSYHCDCGHEETAPVSRAGKLTWRVDWPARWHALGVTIEPFGKDHASRGGSYDTGKRVIREVFHGEPPYPIPYEWLALRGQGDMSSSKGNLVSIYNLTQTVPPEVARYMIFRTKPLRHIAFDPGLPLLNLVDEYDNIESHNRNQRAADLALLEDSPPLGIPFKHLVNLVQITDGEVDKITAILKRHHLPLPSREVLQSRITYAQYWVENYAPAEVRLQLQDTLPAAIESLTPAQREALSTLAERLQPDMNGDDIHTLVYSLTQDGNIEPKTLFQAIYTAFLGQPRGPRVGWFLGSLEFDFVRARLLEAAHSGV